MEAPFSGAWRSNPMSPPSKDMPVWAKEEISRINSWRQELIGPTGLGEVLEERKSAGKPCFTLKMPGNFGKFSFEPILGCKFGDLEMPKTLDFGRSALLKFHKPCATWWNGPNTKDLSWSGSSSLVLGWAKTESVTRVSRPKRPSQEPHRTKSVTGEH